MRLSAGILLYRYGGGGALEVLLVHPGGPFWRRRDAGAWTIPKGAPLEGEDSETAARREFAEELGAPAVGALVPLGRIRQKGGKWVEAFALEGTFDPATLNSNAFTTEWPPRSGRMAAFPEVDEAAWFSLAAAREKINEAQRPLLDRIEAVRRLIEVPVKSEHNASTARSVPEG